MRNNFRIHARYLSRNILVFVTHFSISGDGRPPPIDLIYFFIFYELTYLHIYWPGFRVQLIVQQLSTEKSCD